MHWLHWAVPTQPFVKSFWKLSSMLCYQKATQISLHHIFWQLTSNETWFAGAGVQTRTVLQSPAFERTSFRHCQGNLLMTQSWPTAPPGSLEQRLWDVQIVTLLDFFFSCPTLFQSRRMSLDSYKEERTASERKPSCHVILPRPSSEAAFQLRLGLCLVYQKYCHCLQKARHPY